MGIPSATYCLPVQYSSENSGYLPCSFSLGEEERFLLALKINRGGCLFRLRFGNIGRCGVHESRPSSCRTYPFSKSGKGIRIFPKGICPKEWKIFPGKTMEILGIFRELENEMIRFQGALEIWHEVELPRLAAEKLPRRAFRNRFNRFLQFIEKVGGI